MGVGSQLAGCRVKAKSCVIFGKLAAENGEVHVEVDPFRLAVTRNREVSSRYSSHGCRKPAIEKSIGGEDPCWVSARAEQMVILCRHVFTIPRANMTSDEARQLRRSRMKGTTNVGLWWLVGTDGLGKDIHQSREAIAGRLTAAAVMQFKLAFKPATGPDGNPAAMFEFRSKSEFHPQTLNWDLGILL